MQYRNWHSCFRNIFKIVYLKFFLKILTAARAFVHRCEILRWKGEGGSWITGSPPEDETKALMKKFWYHSLLKYSMLQWKTWKLFIRYCLMSNFHKRLNFGGVGYLSVVFKISLMWYTVLKLIVIVTRHWRARTVDGVRPLASTWHLYRRWTYNQKILLKDNYEGR